MTEYKEQGAGRQGRGEGGRRSEEPLPAGGGRAAGRVADKAAIALVEVQPRQLLVADAE